MITITFTVDTDERGRVFINAQAQGIGSLKETEMAVGVFEAGNAVYNLITEQDGGKPRTTVDPKSRIVGLGQG